MRRSAGRVGVDSGFTLLEMLIVTVLLGVIAAVAVPATNSLIDRWRFSLQRDDVEKQIADLGPRAFLEGKTMVLATPAQTPEGKAKIEREGAIAKLDLPAGWRLTVDPPIIFRADGVCLGGLVSVEADNQRFEYRLQGPRCRPR